VCPDFHPPVGGKDLYNAETAKADGYVQDLCVFLSDKDTHDNGIALVEYDNNVRASHLECFVCNFTDRLYTVIGDRGTLMAHLEDPTHIELRPRWGANRSIPVPPAGEGSHGGADPRLLDNFLAAIRNKTTSSSTLRDGVRAVAVGQAAELSWREHRMVNITELADLNDPVLLGSERIVAENAKATR
jgi:predicted dehydrogenase